MDSPVLSPARKTIVGVQFLFVAFGATVLVPLLVGLDPATALFTAGLGTFIFHLVTKGKVPIFLGSSFAFIAPIISASKQWGMSGTLAGMAGVALVYFVMSALIKWQGRRLLERLFRLLSSGRSSSVLDSRCLRQQSIWQRRTGCWPASRS